MTTRTQLRSISLVLMLLAHGCDDGSPGTDAGTRDASTGMDGSTADASTDASSECMQVSLQSFRLEIADDVSIRYRARIQPDIERQPWDLYLEFNRYDTEYVGEFPLGEGQDASYGGCAHCVIAFYGSMFSRAFYARSGTLVLRDDPFNQRLDMTLRDVVLEEVMIVGDALESVPVPGGICLELAETTVTQTFPSAGWRCPAEQWDDGETCHCSCGAFDPDCGPRCSLPPDPACDPTPLPIAGCEAGDLCTWEGECSATCDHDARVACDGGEVCAFSDQGDRCFAASDARVDDASFGETCAPGAFYCAVDAEGFTMGLCDADTEWLCRPTCAGDADCTVEGEICWTIYFDPATEESTGFCRPAPPPCGETGTSCSDHLDCCTVLCEGLGADGGTTGTCG